MKRFTEVIQVIKKRWTQFSQREKQMVAVGGSVLTLYLCYALIWSPFLNHVDAMRKKVKTNQQLLAWMKSADQVMLELKKSEHQRVRPESLVSFLSVLKQGVQEAALAKSLSQLRQSGSDSIEIHFQNVDFDKAIRFISSILTAHDVHVTQLSVSALPTPGQTNIDMVMKVNLPE